MNRFRTVLFVLAGVLLAGLLLWLLRPFGAEPEAVESAAAAADPAAGVLPAEPAPAPADPVALVERSTAPPIAAEPEISAAKPDKTRLGFRGRCVAAETGAPLAGCTVNFHGWQGNDDLIALYGEPDWKELDPVITGEDGVFSFDVPETLPYQFAIDCHAPGRLPRSDRYDTEIPGGTQHELGDVPMPRGAEVTGIVRDELGVPVEGIEVQFENLPMEIRPGQGAGDTVGASSGADGAFRLAAALPAGDWPVDIYSDDCTLLGPKSVTIEPGLVPVFLEVRVRRSPWIEGIVVDENGKPVPRAYVDTVRHSGGRIEADWTDKQGAFRIHRMRDSEEPVKLTVEEGGLEPAESTEAYAWGSSGIRLQSRRLLTIPIIVREKGSGAPIEDYSLRCHGTTANSSRQTDLRLAGAHPGGSVTVNDVAYGDNLITVIPKDPMLQPNTALRFTAPWETEGPLVIELERLVSLRFRIETSQRAPIAGSTVALLDRAVSDHDSLRFLDPRGGTSSTGGFGLDLDPALWSQGVAGEDGELELFLPSGAPMAVVVVEGKHPRHSLEIARPFEQPQPIVVTVPLGATLHGRLIHPLADSGKVGVVAVPENRRSFGDDPWMPGLGGFFEAHGIPPGNYALHLAIKNDYQEADGDSGVFFGGGDWIEVEPALAQVSLAGDESREIVLDASAFALGALNGRAEISEASPTGLTIDLRLMPPPGETQRGHSVGRFGAYRPDAGQNFRAEQLPPGSYEAEAQWKSADGALRRLRSRNRIAVNAGGNVAGTFEFVRLRLRLRVLDAEGKPLAGVGIQQGAWFERAGPTMVTDADGWVEFDWMNAGQAGFGVLLDPPQHLSGVEVLADQAVTVAEARLVPKEEEAALWERLLGDG